MFLTTSPLFGLALSLLAFSFGLWVQGRFKSALSHPLLTASALVIVILLIFQIPFADYQKGASMLSFFIAPATAALSVNIYKQRQLLKRFFLPVVGGTLVGSLSALLVIKFMSEAFHLDRQLLYSLLPKSVTNAIAQPLSLEYGGLPALTIFSVMISGLIGATFGPSLAKIFKFRPLVTGLAIGTCSHAMGTTRAVELGEIQAAMSGIAIGLAGLFTVIWMALLF